MNETILVTGSTGFIGVRLLKYLESRKVRVKVFLRHESPVSAVPEGVEVVRGSFSDIEALGRAVRGVDRVVHLAGVTKALDEAGYDEGNVMPVKNMLAAIRTYSPDLRRFLYVSSLAAAGPALEGMQGVRESERPSPVSAYGRSKLRAEQCCMEYSESIPVTVVRPPAVYGPGDRDVLQVFQMLAKGVLISPGNSSKQRFSMVYVDDLVCGIMAAAFSEKAPGKIYYITSPSSCSWDELIAAARPLLGFKKLFRLSLPVPFVFFTGTVMGAIGALLGKPALVNSDKVNELLQDYWVCSPELAQLDLGFTAATSLADGVEKTIFWYRRRGWL